MNTPPTVGLIWAQGRNGIIGHQGQMPWHLPEDLAHFKSQTMGCPVIMGRKTWESLPSAFRPLPGRANFVVSRNLAYQAEGARLCGSLDAAIEQAQATRATEIFIIGGAEIYRQALPKADRLYLTEIEQDFVGDAIFPEFSASLWHEIARRTPPLASVASLSFSFVVYQKSAR